MIVPCSIEYIKQDHGKYFLSFLKRYDGICIVPVHLNYGGKYRSEYDFYRKRKMLHLFEHTDGSWQIWKRGIPS